MTAAVVVAHSLTILGVNHLFVWRLSLVWSGTSRPMTVWLATAHCPALPSNRQRSGWVVSLLGVQPADQVLEIGFGPGLAVAELVRAGAGHVYGIDHSA